MRKLNSHHFDSSLNSLSTAGRIGWEEPLYSVVEGDVLPYQTVSACARVFEPDAALISSDVLAAIFADDVDTGSATSE